MQAAQLRAHVIEPTLDYLGMGGAAAVELMLGTAAQESRFDYLQQIDGPALGLWQVEPATHDDIWENYLRYRHELGNRLRALIGNYPQFSHKHLITNLAYACAIARLVYYRRPNALPPAGDLAGQAQYWKTFYNTHLGCGAVEDYVANYRRLVEGA